MILDNTVKAGTILICKKSRFGGHPENEGDATLAVVLTPASRQMNRIVDAVPLSDTLPQNRDVLNVRIKNDGLRALSRTGEWFAICDRLTRVDLDSDDVKYLRRDRGAAVNFEPRYNIAGEDLKSIRLSMVIQLFPDSDIRTYFRRSLLSFRKMASKLTLSKKAGRTSH